MDGRQARTSGAFFSYGTSVSGRPLELMGLEAHEANRTV